MMRKYRALGWRRCRGPNPHGRVGRRVRALPTVPQPDAGALDPRVRTKCLRRASQAAHPHVVPLHEWLRCIAVDNPPEGPVGCVTDNPAVHIAVRHVV